jgi:hypothetical protein
VPYVEHASIEEAANDERSRYVVMAGVRVENPEAVARRLEGAGDDRVLEALRDVAFEIRIAFASKLKVAAMGEDWRYVFLRELVDTAFDMHRHERRGRSFPLIVSLPERLPFDYAWLGAYLTNTVYTGARVQARCVPDRSPLLALPALVARLFHDALENERGRPCPARDRYDGIAPLISHLEDVGLNVSYARGVVADAIVRSSQSS